MQAGRATVASLDHTAMAMPADAACVEEEIAVLVIAAVVVEVTILLREVSRLRHSW